MPQNTPLPSHKWPGGGGYVQASRPKAVAVVYVRLINSPATGRPANGAVVEVDFEHMDNRPTPIANAPESEAPRTQNLLSVLIPSALVVFLLALCFLKLALLAVFLGSWAATAYFGLRMKQSKLLSFGGGFIVACVALVAFGSLFMPKASSSENGQESQYKPSKEESGKVAVNSLVWENIDADTRKSLAEMKLRDAEQLAKELDELLMEFNRGNVTVELVGKAKSWRHGVDFISSEIEEAGWKPGRDDSGTAMGQVHSALQSMTVVWDRFQKFIAATSSSERESHATAHANHLKLMRDNLRYAHEWSAKGRY